MKDKIYIPKFGGIANGKAFVNNKVLFESDSRSIEDSLKGLYRQILISYPKFFKMDLLSKLTLLTAELLLHKPSLEQLENDIALVFSNKTSSLHTDRIHQRSIANKENYYPSPSIFVYTLPNIGMGEVAIRHKLRSENAFFVFSEFNGDFLQDYAVSLLQQKNCDAVLCGWAEVEGDFWESFFCLIEKEQVQELKKGTLNKLYQTRSWKP